MILDKIRKTISDHKLLNRGDSVLIGLSGGADSVCLTHVLHALSDELGITLYTAHVNHGIRGDEAARDEEFAKKFSETLGIEYFILHADIPTIAKEKGISEEAAGRIVRYDFFKNLCEKHGIDKIATAHNKNDSAETILMNFMRGSALGGLCGIPYRRDNIIRPILDIERAEIEEYCKSRELEYMTDSTNNERVYTRNKIRHTLIPLVQEEFNSNFINTVTDNAVLIKEDSAYIEKQAAKVYDELVHGGNAQVKALLGADRAVCRRVIRYMIRDARESLSDIPSVYVNDILSLLSKPSGTSINLMDGIIAKIEYARLIIEHEQQEIKPFEYTFSCNSRELIPEISQEVIISEAETRKKDGAVYIACDINDKITVRSRREGDKFYPDGMTGSKKVKEYFINEKIPRDKRNAVPIIEINGRIAAVGYRVDRNFLFKGSGIRIEFKPIREVKN